MFFVPSKGKKAIIVPPQGQKSVYGYSLNFKILKNQINESTMSTLIEPANEYSSIGQYTNKKSSNPQ